MDTDSNKITWVVVIVAAVAIMGGLFIKFVPNMTSQMQGYVQTVTGKLRGVDSSSVVDSSSNSDFIYSPADTKDDTISITGYKGNKKDVTIPTYRKIGSVSYKVTDIEDDAFYENKSIRHVTIPDSVQIIGVSAFQNNSNLEQVTLGSGVTSIGKWAFNKTALTSVDIPDSVQDIGFDAFDGDSNLKQVTLGSGLTHIGGSAFSSTGLTSVDFPASLKSIDYFAFMGTPLSSISFKSPVKLGWNVFMDNKLTNVTLPTGSTYITQGSDVTFDSNVTVTVK